MGVCLHSLVMFKCVLKVPFLIKLASSCYVLVNPGTGVGMCVLRSHSLIHII